MQHAGICSWHRDALKKNLVVKVLVASQEILLQTYDADFDSQPYRDITPIMEHQVEKRMEAPGPFQGVYKDIGESNGKGRWNSQGFVGVYVQASVCCLPGQPLATMNIVLVWSYRSHQVWEETLRCKCVHEQHKTPIQACASPTLGCC